jgi:hypothetical protein
MSNRWLKAILGATVGAIVSGTSGMSQSLAQSLAQTPSSTIADCLPPASNEYLLFAVTRTTESQTLLRSKAPTDATTMVCKYQSDIVTRVGGFGSEASAAAWGQYLIRATGITTTIVRPTPVAAPAKPEEKPNAVGTGAVGKRFAPGVYQPQNLSSGYAVLVNYNNRPEVAVQLGQVLNQEIGVAVYGERPYLFVMQTGELSAANAVVKLLTDRGFLALRVEAKSVVVLRKMK